MTDDLVQRLFAEADNFKVDREVGMRAMLYRAADRIEQLEREKAVVSDLWEQQKEIALDYLTDCNKAADRIEAQAAEIERLEALFTNSTYEAKAMMEEIDRRGAEIQALREMQGKDSHD
jgi:uncharacterized protein (UPF0335 family)